MFVDDRQLLASVAISGPNPLSDWTKCLPRYDPLSYRLCLNQGTLLNQLYYHSRMVTLSLKALGFGKNSTSDLLRFMKPISSFFTDHSELGWVAFGIALLVFLVFIAFEYRKEAHAAQKALLEAKSYHSANSERDPLLVTHHKHDPNEPKATEYHQIGSEDDIGLDESLRSTPSYIYPQYRPVGGRTAGGRRSDNYRTSPFLLNSKERVAWPRNALRQIYPSDVSSVGSIDTSRSYPRPLSYREMRRSNQNSPTVLPAVV